MSPFFEGILSGLFVGVFIGVFVVALLQASRKNWLEETRRGTSKDEEIVYAIRSCAYCCQD